MTVLKKLQTTSFPVPSELYEAVRVAQARLTAAQDEWIRLAEKSPEGLFRELTPAQTPAPPAPRKRQLTKADIEWEHLLAAHLTLQQAIGESSLTRLAVVHLGTVAGRDLLWGNPTMERTSELTMSVLHFARPRVTTGKKDPLARYRRTRYFQAILAFESGGTMHGALDQIPEYAAIRAIARSADGERSEEALYAETERLYTVARESLIAVWPHVCWMASSSLRGTRTEDGAHAWELFEVGDRVSAVLKRHSVDASALSS